jgi:AbrB family looped-hinge helix DNA binding protein
MAHQVTIDGAGRLVIPKELRDRFGLEAGTRLHIHVSEGGIHLTPDRPEPALVERDGFLVLELPTPGASRTDHRVERDRRTPMAVG